MSVILFAITRKPYETWDRIIDGMGKASYSYLPSLLINHDPAYTFLDQVDKKYYPPGTSSYKEFIKSGDGKPINKGSTGSMVLWIPFFTGAHLSSHILQFEPDGFSMIYQYSIALAAFFYFSIGLFYLHSLLLSIGFKNTTSGAVLYILVLCSPLLYYLILEPAHPAIYTFSLANVFLYYASRGLQQGKISGLATASFVLGLLILLYPPNLLLVLLLPLIRGNRDIFRKGASKMIPGQKTIFLSLLIFLVILFPAFISWILTGDFFGNLQTLFHPIFSTGNVTAFLAGFLAVLAVFLARFIDHHKPFALKVTFLLSLFILGMINLSCFSRHRPVNPVSISIHENSTSFFSLKPLKKVFSPGKNEILEIYADSIDFGHKPGWLKAKKIIHFDEVKGAVAIGDKSNPYCFEYRRQFSERLKGDHTAIGFQANFMTDSHQTGSILHFEFQANMATYANCSFEMKETGKKDQWVRLNIGIMVPERFTDSDFIRIYLQLPETGERIFLDDLVVSYYSLKKTQFPPEAVFLTENKVIDSTVILNDLEKDYGWKNQNVLTTDVAYSGRYSTRIDQGTPFSLLFERTAQPLFHSTLNFILAETMLFSGDSIRETRMIAEITRKDKSIWYQAYYMDPLFKPGQWNKAIFLVNLPDNLRPSDMFRIYYWNPSKKEIVFLDNIKFRIFSLKPI